MRALFFLRRTDARDESRAGHRAVQRTRDAPRVLDGGPLAEADRQTGAAMLVLHRVILFRFCWGTVGLTRLP